MKLTKEQTQEILKTIDKVERQTEDFTLTLRRARRAIEMNDQSAMELLLTAYEQKERSTLLCRALPIYSPRTVNAGENNESIDRRSLRQMRLHRDRMVLRGHSYTATKKEKQLY